MNVSRRLALGGFIKMEADDGRLLQSSKQEMRGTQPLCPVLRSFHAVVDLLLQIVNSLFSLFFFCRLLGWFRASLESSRPFSKNSFCQGRRREVAPALVNNYEIGPAPMRVVRGGSPALQAGKGPSRHYMGAPSFDGR